MRIKELKDLEEKEGTWCLPRRWSKSLKRWLEYSTLARCPPLIITHFFYLVKLRWRSGRLSEKQINDLTAIGIIKDGRFYGIRDKRELERELQQEALGSPDSGQHETDSSDNEEQEADEKEHAWLSYAHNKQNEVKQEVKESQKQDADSYRSPTDFTSKNLQVIDPLTAIASSIAPTTGNAQLFEAAHQRLRLLCDAENLRSSTLLQEIMRKEKERELLIREYEQSAQSIDVTRIPKKEENLEDLDEEESHQDSNNEEVSESSVQEGKETGILYEVETEEEWKKLTKEQRRQRRMAQLHQFYVEFGHGNVQHQWPKNKRLANWVYEQKQRWRKGLLSDVQSCLLRITCYSSDIMPSMTG